MKTGPSVPTLARRANERADRRDEAPRVLDLRAGAKYLGISYWSLRDLVLGGHVPAVRLPCPRVGNGRIMRRLLVDRRDLDDLIERSRERHD